MEKMLYIVGVGRSGTSLLQSMFAGNPHVTMLPETSFFRRYVAKGTLTASYLKKGYHGVRFTLENDIRFKRLAVDVDEIVDDVFSFGAKKSIDLAVYEKILDIKRAGKNVVGDKDPRAIEYLKLMHDSFADVHIINIIRDPRDVLASKKEAAWSSRRSAFWHILAARSQLSMGRKDGIRLGGKYHEVIYEKLIHDPAGELQRLCVEIGLKYDDAMLDFSPRAGNLVAQDEREWKSKVMGPLIRDNHGAWKSVLTDFEIVITELSCNEHFKAGGYEFSDSINNLNAYGNLRALIASLLIRAASFCFKKYRSFTVWLQLRKL